MDIGSILMGLALALLVAVYIGRPILQKTGQTVSGEDRRLSELQAQRDRILNRLQELDMDFAMGKLLEQDYRSERDALMVQGAEILKAIDSLVGALPDPGTGQVDEIEVEIARIRGKGRPTVGSFCPHCGTEVQEGDAFCTRCGTSLVVA
jgi:hypothetical protein